MEAQRDGIQATRNILDAASGFLLKRARPAEFVEAIRIVASGEPRLTEREAEVLRLMARGKSNAEIASDLFLSVETVKTHVGNVLAKLDARDRTQAVIAAYESGFVRPG